MFWQYGDTTHTFVEYMGPYKGLFSARIQRAAVQRPSVNKTVSRFYWEIHSNQVLGQKHTDMQTLA